MSEPITRTRIIAAMQDLQSVALDATTTGRNTERAYSARSLLDEIQMDMRRGDIYAAGALADLPLPEFEGDKLGSAESLTFYDGYASTHPEFQNPYRRRVR